MMRFSLPFKSWNGERREYSCFLEMEALGFLEYILECFVNIYRYLKILWVFPRGSCYERAIQSPHPWLTNPIPCSRMSLGLSPADKCIWQKLCHHYQNRAQTKNSSDPFWILIFLSRSYSFGNVHTVPSFPQKPYPIPDQNTQSAYPFLDQKGPRPYLLGQHIPIRLI